MTSAPLNGGAQTFGYDANGNWISMNGGTAYASNNLNQYTTFNGLGVTYDGNGNLESYNGWTYTYDAQNRLKTVLQGTTTMAQYWYDGAYRYIRPGRKIPQSFDVYSFGPDGQESKDDIYPPPEGQ